MIQKQRRLISKRELAACGCEPEDRVLIAFSGGADSTALLLSMQELFLEGRIGGLFAAHLNHGIRGENAERDQRFCESLCEKIGIPIATETQDVPLRARTRGQTLEQAAREARYEFLEQARRSFGASLIATAHHREDQAETVLMHLLRGSGMTGLCGMKPRNGLVIRPMLQISRDDILSYLQNRGVGFCEDETNEQNGPMRNRIRNDLMPQLRRYNPAVAESLGKTASLLAQDEALLTQLAQEAERDCSVGDGLDRAKLALLPQPLKSRIVHKRLMQTDGNATEQDIVRILSLTRAKTGTKIELHGGYFAWTDALALYIGEHPETAVYEVPFVREGITATPRGLLFCERVSRWQKTQGGCEAYLDLDALPEPLVVRSRQNGDRFFPLGAPGERKLSDVLTDRKIPKEERDLPLLCSGNTVYYAAGLTISERAKVQPETREILHILYNRGDRD